MSMREEENPGASCPNQPNSRRRRRTSGKKVKWLKHYLSDHLKLLVGERLMSLVEEENPGAICTNQPNSCRRRRRSRRSRKEVKWLKHYSSDHRILLVGEGDFSFSLSLGMAFGDASNIVATSLDSYDVVIKKYKGAKTNLEILHSLGAQLIHEVDALQMKLHTDLQMHKFDRIIFNFPHAGHQRVIMMHRNLVCDFFKNASGMLRPTGEVHVTHKTSDPYQSWNIEELATQNSLTLLECIEFNLEDYPGYSNKRGDGKRCDTSFPLGECSTYKFVLIPKGNSSKEDGLCNCDPPLRRVEHTSWSKRNPNRRFMGCPKYRGPESAHCKSIDWIDPPLSGRYKKAMYELRLLGHERDEKEKLMQSLTRQRNEKEAAIKALVEEKIQKEKLTEALKSLNAKTDACKEKLMQSLTRQRNENYPPEGIVEDAWSDIEESDVEMKAIEVLEEGEFIPEDVSDIEEAELVGEDSDEGNDDYIIQNAKMTAQEMDNERVISLEMYLSGDSWKKVSTGTSSSRVPRSVSDTWFRRIPDKMDIAYKKDNRVSGSGKLKKGIISWFFDSDLQLFVLKRFDGLQYLEKKVEALNSIPLCELKELARKPLVQYGKEDLHAANMALHLRREVLRKEFKKFAPKNKGNYKESQSKIDPITGRKRGRVIYKPVM